MFSKINKKINSTVFWTVVVLIVGFCGTLGKMHIDKMSAIATQEMRLNKIVNDKYQKIEEQYHDMHTSIAVIGHKIDDMNGYNDKKSGTSSGRK